jgi:hypothetical protein
MKIIIIFLSILLNICYANDSIVKMKLVKIEKIKNNKKIYLFELMDKNKKNKLFFTDSLQKKYKVNSYYCYYDKLNKEIISKKNFETTWFEKEYKTNKSIFMSIVFNRSFVYCETYKITCKKIKKNKNKNINFKWEIETSEGNLEYSNFKFKINEIIYYKNISGLISNETFEELY